MAESETQSDAANEESSARRARAELVADLFNQHNESLVRFLCARTRSRQEAKEVAQEAYVRVLNLDQPGAVSFMRAFLFRTAANLAIDRMRSRDRRAILQETRLFAELDEALTPERAAVGVQEVEIVTRLIDAKVDLNARNERGESALSAAAIEHHSSVVKVLIERGAAANLPYQKPPPLHAAVMANDDESVAAILAAGADPGAKDGDGMTAAERASAHGRLRALRVLLSAR